MELEEAIKEFAQQRKSTIGNRRRKRQKASHESADPSVFTEGRRKPVHAK